MRRGKTYYRINAFVAKSLGISRRKADSLLKTQPWRVRVNGHKFDGNLSLRIDPNKDEVLLDGNRLFLPTSRFIMLNKPRGYVTSVSDPYNKTVMDLLPKSLRSLKPIGRLDRNTRGLLLLTDDGRIIHPLLHPKYKIEKEYIVKVDGKLTDMELDRIRKGGIVVENKPSLPCQARLIKVGIEESEVRLTMVEGKKRQIRKMFAFIGHPVRDLIRIRFGPIKLGKLPEGKYRHLTKKEKEKLYSLVGIPLCSDT